MVYPRRNKKARKEAKGENPMNEKWRDIPGYEGLYQASTEGEIRTAHGKTTFTEHHGVRHWKSRILKGRGDYYRTGKRVNLWKDGKPKEFLQARLVAMTWVSGYAEGLTVNHINGNRFDNRVKNLEWLTLHDNILHGFRTGLYNKVMIPVTLKSKSTGEIINFKSMSSASEFLGKGKHYISGRLKKQRYEFGGYEAINLPHDQRIAVGGD